VARHRATDAIRDAMLARFAARWHVDFHELETDVIAARCAATGPMPPLLVLHATDDEQVPVAEAGYLASLWPGATLQLVPHGGHSSLLRDPDVVQRVVRFIAP
jgi:pimeloyl-ACP methyl ester carboxylesterase